jgi:hypothetical protein
MVVGDFYFILVQIFAIFIKMQKKINRKFRKENTQRAQE